MLTSRIIFFVHFPYQAGRRFDAVSRSIEVALNHNTFFDTQFQNYFRVSVSLLILLLIQNTKLFAARMPLVGKFSRDSTFLERRHVDPRSTKTPTRKQFPFLRLPPELRAMIYKPLIQAGDLRILRTSKLINQEAVPYLSEVAKLRVNLGRSSINGGSKVTLALTAEITLSGALTLIAPYYIQHIELRLDLITRPSTRIDTKLIACFTGNKITRKSCKITVKFSLLGPIPYNLDENKTYQVIAALTGFMVLTLRLEYRRDAAYEDSLLRRISVLPLFNTASMLFGYYETVSTFLHDNLGPAILNRSVGGHCLKFSPLVHQRT